MCRVVTGGHVPPPRLALTNQGEGGTSWCSPLGCGHAKRSAGGTSGLVIGHWGTTPLVSDWLLVPPQMQEGPAAHANNLNL